ncbi:MAG: hypothetical protein HYR56_21860 [Acidobacteria bacterium]|nr:hypothetical protein [Acidobacteriota bacterium]MBI3425835.1 hypothetical protein [Acidobacteriota bacterium]
MNANIKNIRLTHERDAAWLIALYLAIHGGDPAPKEGLVATELQEGAALHAIAVLSEALNEKAKGALHQMLAPMQKQFPLKSVDAQVAGERLAALGIHVTEHAGEHDHVANVAEAIQSARRYCIRFRGQIICVEIPSPIPHPIA